MMTTPLCNARGVRNRIVLVAAVLFGLRLATLIPWAIDSDEGWFAVSGLALSLNSPFKYFNVAADNKPPGTAWFYWLIHQISGLGTLADARPARFAFILLMVLLAWVVGRTITVVVDARRGDLFAGLSRRGWFAAFLAWVGVVLPAPILFSATTEAMMCLPLAVAFLLIVGALIKRRPLTFAQAASYGFVIGLLPVFKQTAVFFAPFFLYGLAVLRRHGLLSRRGASVSIVAALIPFWFVVATLGARDLWGWLVIYPTTILDGARSSYFMVGRSLLTNTVLFALGLWPLWGSAWRNLFAELGPIQRDLHRLLLVWFFGGALAVLVGKGLFLHYYQYLAVPLVILAMSSSSSLLARFSIPWFAGTYSILAIAVSLPALGGLWGSDLFFYQRVSGAVRKLAGPAPLKENAPSMFVWGGNALAYLRSGVRPFSPFLTARFVTAPYSSTETANQFKQTFLTEKPQFVLDLHERGDNRFNVPLTAIPWLAALLEQNYRAYRDPALPWFCLYRRIDPEQRSVAGEAVNKFEEPGVPPKPFSYLLDSFANQVAAQLAAGGRSTAEVVAMFLRQPSAAFALEALVRARYASDDDWSIRLDPAIQRQIVCLQHREKNSCAGSAPDRKLALEALDWQKKEAQYSGTAEPLGTGSMLAWWISASTVRFQPVLIPR